MQHENLINVVESVLSEFGTPVALGQGQMPENSMTYATIETVFNIRSDAEGSTLAQDLKNKIQAQIEQWQEEGIVRTVQGNIQKLHLVTEEPKVTYREPIAHDIPDGILYVVYVGIPFHVTNNL